MYALRKEAKAVAASIRVSDSKFRSPEILYFNPKKMRTSLALLSLLCLFLEGDAKFAVPYEHLYPSSASSRTRSTHRKMMSTWRSPTRSAPGVSPVVNPIDFGADPTGVKDSTAAFVAAVAELLKHNTSGHMMSDGIVDLGGVVLDLQGGDYLVNAPVQIPQFVGNLRIIDGTIRAGASFPPNAYVIQVGASPCKTKSGQGSCNENVGMSGLTLDASHIAQGCLSISSTMGATLDSSSAIFGFTGVGILLDGGHETMISETWVAAYFWNDPKKEHSGDTIGILVAGNDHFVDNVIVFSGTVGVSLTGEANKLVNVHTWNCATGNGGIGILNTVSQNIFIGCYLDFTDLVLTNAQQISISNGFFLGDAQLVFKAPHASSSIYGVSIVGNEWYDCSNSALASNETLGTWTSVTDLYVEGTSFCGPGQNPAFSKATKVLSSATVNGKVSVDFSDILLFPNVPIASASIVVKSNPTNNVAPTVGQNWNAQVVDVFISTNDPLTIYVTADQSSYTTERSQK
jgi:hypothetical protein